MAETNKKVAATTVEKPAPTLNNLAKVYVKMRDKKAELKRAFDEEEGKLKAKMTIIEVEMLRILNAQDANSINTEHGTVIRQQEIKPSCSDWGAFYDWIKEHDAFDALERRVKSSFIKEYMADNDEALPPGVAVMREFVVRVRRK